MVYLIFTSFKRGFTKKVRQDCDEDCDMENSSLKFSGLSCIRGERLVFSDLAIELKAGQALSLSGSNGSGKTSLLRLLAGLLPADAVLCRDFHFIGTQDGVKSSLTVEENLQFWCDMLGGRGIEAALAFWDLQNLRDMPALYLSAGQRRRLALSRLLLAPKKIWLLDEPQVALDEQNRARLLKLLEDHLSGGGMAVIAAHEDLNLKNAKSLRMGKAA